ncbi:Phosphoribosylformylglycinamidine synthase [uncultured Paludibacter sp.]|uniref:Phosphoribosylformylglycinamidine synthase n=1 Tax=uncultured Paludibacter sp. TaxID=497635 RepID=A0A653A5N4_9BACT|nr:Phosphoribosylformylglycinamidine synthase [uncultured Paludibacter sp.]
MILFFQTSEQKIYAVQTQQTLSKQDIEKLIWLFDGAKQLNSETVPQQFIGPRREMITPWSTNAVEITQNMGIKGISRIEEFSPKTGDDFDPMLQRIYKELNQDIFTINKQPEPILHIDDIAFYNEKEGLALSSDEIEYLNDISQKIGRKLTDSEVFGFSQVNSEHCRHKIFNGQFVIDGEEKELSLFKLIKRTSEENPNNLVSAYKDNVAFNQGPEIEQFAPQAEETSSFFETKEIESVISLKAETHNFPTTVEPFNGAATGTGGEIRDRLGGGKASLPIAGTAVYMTSSPRLFPTSQGERLRGSRQWLYQTPSQILIKASNGASDFGNKFGQPLICGSVLTFEHQENNKMYGYDKVIMLAGGVGFGKKKDALKGEPKAGDKVVVMGGDNYRIGMGGGAVSSVETGQYDNAIELNAVQRANPEMQKRVANVIRALAESDENPIVSIHDHGAGGHLNCLSELVETTGGVIEMDKLPIGDPTLSAKEIIGNESQERMGLLIKEKDIERVQKIAERERAPMYVVGEANNDQQFTFKQKDGEKPLDLQLAYLIGKPPRTVITDNSIDEKFSPVVFEDEKLLEYIQNVLQMEAVACKDWLTNKVDRSVTGKIAQQQCVGELQLPLANLGVVSLDYRGKSGIATSIGHAPLPALIDPEAGSVLAIAEALTNIVWTPLKDGLEGVSLSANWMWPSKNAGEDARLYRAVEACSDFACSLGINIPTGKDSLSMTQKYPNGDKVFAPGTVIISAAAEATNIRKIVNPVIVNNTKTTVYYIDFSFDTFKLGGSVLAQTLGKIGDETPTVNDAEYFKDTFNTIQELIEKNLILAGHDISEGGMITALLEMCFANTKGGLNINLDYLSESSLVKILFAENPGVLVQIKDTKSAEKILKENGIGFARIGYPIEERRLEIHKKKNSYSFSINELRDLWYQTSYLLDKKQTVENQAKSRFENYKKQPLEFKFPETFKGKLSQYNLTPDRKPSGIKAAIIREKGTNGEREMAYSLYLAGFDVKDVMMTDLVSGRETLEDVNMIVFCGGFSNSDVLGSAKGWAGGFMYNEKAKTTLENFYKRSDTLSLGICNGCQLMVELNLVNPEHEKRTKMLHNNSHKFESNFISLAIPENNSVMFGSLSGSKLGIWVAHGEGKFSLPMGENNYNVIAKYNYDVYPANPNGSDFGVAGICSADGRHLAMMPHLERAIFPWQCANYPAERMNNDEVTPWIEAFVNARKWVENKK